MTASIRNGTSYETPLVILGGGVAGLTLALALTRSGLACRVFERSAEVWAGGLGFILMPDGMAALDRLGLGETVRHTGVTAWRAEVRSALGEPRSEKPLPEHVCIERRALIRMLRDELPEDVSRLGATFEGFEQGLGGSREARFEGGERCRASAYVGADGKRSRVRTILFPAYRLEGTPVTELISIVKAPELVEMWRGRLLKFKDDQGGLAVGIAPIGEGLVAWYIQFDVRAHPAPCDEAQEKERFAHDLLEGWADPLADLLRRTDFAQSYLARVVTMPTLPRLCDQNAVLLGDAAHPLPTLLGQGANAAVCDALLLAETLRGCSVPEGFQEGFRRYSQQRLPAVEALNQEGLDRVADFTHACSHLSDIAL